MVKEGLKISDNFPSYSRWITFLKQSGMRQAVRYPVGKSNPDWIFVETSNRSVSDIKNKYSFFNYSENEQVVLEPHRITQQYIVPDGSYRIENYLDHTHAGSLLSFPHPTVQVAELTVFNTTSEHEIMMVVVPAYLHELRKSLVPADAEDQIRIQLGEGTVQASIAMPNQQIAQPIYDDLIPILFEDAGIKHVMYDEKTGEIRGQVNNYRFVLDPVRPETLDPKTVWKKITGRTKQQFLFPVTINKI